MWKSTSDFTPIIAMLLGALVPLVIGSLFAVVKRAVSRRVTFHSPESDALVRIEGQLTNICQRQEEMSESQEASAKAIRTIDLTIGLVVPALKITTKKVRQELGLDDGEEFNGDLQEAWEKIKRAEALHEDLRSIEAGGCE